MDTFGDVADVTDVTDVTDVQFGLYNGDFRTLPEVGYNPVLRRRALTDLEPSKDFPKGSTLWHKLFFSEVTADN